MSHTTTDDQNWQPFAEIPCDDKRRFRGVELGTLRHTPSDSQLVHAAEALPAVEAALAEFRAAEERCGLSAQISSKLLDAIEGSQPLARELMLAELDAVPDDRARALRLRLMIEGLFIPENAQYFAEHQIEVFRATTRARR